MKYMQEGTDQMMGVEHHRAVTRFKARCRFCGWSRWCEEDRDASNELLEHFQTAKHRENVLTHLVREREDWSPLE
jgi:hypothetical protein